MYEIEERIETELHQAKELAQDREKFFKTFGIHVRPSQL